MLTQSLHNFLYEQNICSELRHLILEIGRASKYVSHAVRTGDLGKAGTSNLYGESQMTLDVLSDEIFCNILKEADSVSAFASEEQEEAIRISQNGKYCIAFDPLDGSSLIDVNGPVGSIFGIWQGDDFIGKSGNDLIAAGYVQYGPRTTMVLAINKTVNEFILNDIGEFQLGKKDLTLSKDGNIFATGNLRACKEKPKYKAVLDYFLDSQKTLRYTGGMVPDINSILMKGHGIFTYPSHSAYPNGKLRLMYECAPFAYIIETAGGKALTETGENVLDIKCKKLHDRVTIFVGSKNEVEKCVEILR